MLDKDGRLIVVYLTAPHSELIAYQPPCATDVFAIAASAQLGTDVSLWIQAPEFDSFPDVTYSLVFENSFSTH
ncbi:hypothetical protein Y032_0003g1268 [Ancylostoma ceylanicum]|uniref:Uncharacterized protein n=1 Tax=Ancylostoma ceylanicum TaxID=53326 RepID=A0A016VWY2_9BILA|nr:hypothetical protein Y032_0003g1268 [Ancylostoma ceylanicum]